MWEEPKRTKRNCNAIMRKTIENHWKPWKSMPCTVRGRFCSRCKLCSNWGTLSSTCSSMSLSKLIIKLTMLVEWGLLGVRWHSDVARCCYVQRTFTKQADATGSRASLNICLTYAKKESWSTPWRHPNTWIIIGVIGTDLWSIHRSRLEQVGGCRWTTVDYRKHHAFAIHSRPKCWKPNRLQWG